MSTSRMRQISPAPPGARGLVFVDAVIAVADAICRAVCVPAHVIAAVRLVESVMPKVVNV